MRLFQAFLPAPLLLGLGAGCTADARASVIVAVSTGAAGSDGSSAGAGGSPGGTGGSAEGGSGGSADDGSAGGELEAGRLPDAPGDATITDVPLDAITDTTECNRAVRENVELGIPVDGDPSDDVILDHGSYIVSYNPTKNDPNWVSWHLSADDLGSASRQDDFRSDDLLPAMYYHVKAIDYQGSGYDRGHMSPSGDNTASVAMNSTSFLMTNMVPQLHALNAGPWELLENFERSLALGKKDVFIVAGGIFDTPASTIGPGIAVPKSCFKILVVLEPGQGPCDVALSTPIYAVVMPNTAATEGKQWGDYATSIDAIEASTGYDFLSGVPLALQEAIESRITKAP